MHASIWRFAGDPDALLGAYDAMVAEIPREAMRLHLCLRAGDGIVMVDTCPSREIFESFVSADWCRELRERTGMPEPTMLDHYPVHVAFVDGEPRG